MFTPGFGKFLQFKSEIQGLNCSDMTPAGDRGSPDRCLEFLLQVFLLLFVVEGSC